MRLVLPTLASALLLITLPGLCSEAHAHGGAYRGPAGEVPPTSRGPSDPPPPPDDGGPTTGPGETDGGPTTGDGGIDDGPTTGDDGTPDRGGPSTGPTTGPSGPKGPSTGRRPAAGRSRGLGFEDWTFWWNFNKDDVLQVKSALRRSGAGTGDGVHGFGRGRTLGPGRVSTTDAAIWEQIVPALRGLVAEESLNFDIRSAAAIALAKIGDRSVAPALRRMATNARSDGYHRVVEESAALALGLLQDPSRENVEFLLDLVADRDRNASFVRPFAAVSLGLLQNEAHEERVIEALLQVVAGRETKPDVKPAALVGLGLLRSDRAVPALVHIVREGRVDADALAGVRAADELSDLEVSFAVQALGKIGSPAVGDDAHGVVDLCIALLTGRRAGKVDTNIRRAAAIALGQLGPQCDGPAQRRVVRALTTAAQKGKDASERTFSMIALGRLVQDAPGDAEHADEVVRTLRRQLDNGRPAQLVQPFAALALGLAGRGMRGTEESIKAPLRAKFVDSDGSAPRARGAYAIASGLVVDALATDALVETLRDRGADMRLRGYSAVALGLIQNDEARPAIRDTLADDSHRGLRIQTAVAAGLMGDPEAVRQLVDILESGDGSQYVLGSVALALGQIGDERAIAPLLELATSEERPDITRALATVALGQIGDRRDVPVLARVARDINFRAIGAVPALTELLTIL